MWKHVEAQGMVQRAASAAASVLVRRMAETARVATAMVMPA